MLRNRIWIIGKKSLEATTVIDMLKRKGAKIYITNQPSDAYWENLEPEIKEELKVATIAFGIGLKGNVPENGEILTTYGEDENEIKSSMYVLNKIISTLEQESNIKSEHIENNDDIVEENMKKDIKEIEEKENTKQEKITKFINENTIDNLLRVS
ncbi:MAG: hypothetical protein RSE00_04495 [Clostridia bacterium]